MGSTAVKNAHAMALPANIYGKEPNVQMWIEGSQDVKWQITYKEKRTCIECVCGYRGYLY